MTIHCSAGYLSRAKRVAENLPEDLRKADLPNVVSYYLARLSDKAEALRLGLGYVAGTVSTDQIKAAVRKQKVATTKSKPSKERIGTANGVRLVATGKLRCDEEALKEAFEDMLRRIEEDMKGGAE